MEKNSLNVYNADTIEENEARAIEFKVQNETNNNRMIRNDISAEDVMAETNSLE